MENSSEAPVVRTVRQHGGKWAVYAPTRVSRYYDTREEAVAKAKAMG